MVTLTSNCCNEPDRLFRKVLDMNYSEMGICRRCGGHCDYESNELIEQLQQAATGNDLISFTIRQGIQNKASHLEIIEYIKSQARDNKQMIAGCIGETLTTTIMAL